MAQPALRAVALDPEQAGRAEEEVFPFCVPGIASLQRLELAPVTLFVGENGSGKSTLLEAIAWAAELPVTGAAPGEGLAEAETLGRALRLTWRRRSRRGLVLRAEDFFAHVRGVRRDVRELTRRADRLEREARASGAHEGEGVRRAAPFRGSSQALRARYGEDPEARSHGEQFLDFFRARLVPGGLFVLDEPEAALSPTGQLAFLALGMEAVRAGAQLVIASHAPILMAWPDARLLHFGDVIAPIAFDDVPHVRLLRDFLRRPGSFLRHL